MPAILFAVESAESRSLPLDGQRLVNFFTEKESPGAKSQTPLFGVPGMSAFANTATTVGGIAAVGTITGGSGYVPANSGIATLGTITGGSGYGPGTYLNVPLTGGSGSGATATIVVDSDSQVSAVTLTDGGTDYLVGDAVSAAASDIGGAGVIYLLGSQTVGSGYTDGTYTDVPLTGGSGSGAQATIVVFGSSILSVTLTTPGTGYLVGDTLTAAASTIGGTGSGFSVPVTAVQTTGSGFAVSVATVQAFNNVPLTGGSGTGAAANFTVGDSGAITAVAVTVPGINYQVGDILSANNADIGGTGNGVATLGSITGGSNYIDSAGGGIATLGTLKGGSGYKKTGTYTEVPLTGGSGSGAQATIVVGNDESVTSVTVTTGGVDYLVGDVLSAKGSSIGGTAGINFSVPVATINNFYGNVALTGGSGSGATANISVGSGAVIAVTIVTEGIDYEVGDVLSAAASDIGGTGNGVATLGSITGGSGYTDGTYTEVPLTGGSGSGAQATIVVSSKVVSSVTITAAGIDYNVGDTLSAASSILGSSGSDFSAPVASVTAAGSGFSVPVASVTAPGSGFSVSVTLISTAGTIRGSWVKQDIPYVVSGNTLYQVNKDGSTTIVGTSIAGSDMVGMSDNGHQLCIVSGQSGQGWILDTNSASATYGFQNITAAWTAAGFGPANTVSFFDGYFVFDMIGTNEFFLSALYDGTTYNGLDFASAESQPDFVTGTVQNLQLLFVICQQHLELWYDAGAANFPFQRYTGAGISYGCVSPQTIIKQDGAIFFLGNDKIFYRLQSTVPIRISTHAMEHIIAQDADLTAAYCFTYTLEGHKFIVLQLPSSKRTLVFDISTNRWHERESWDQNNASLGLWRASTAFSAFNNTYLGDAFNGTVNLLDWTVYTESGNTIRGLAYSIPYHQDRKRLFVSRFELDIQAGVGTSSGAGSDPQIMLGWSVDGANTFQPLQPWRSMGRIGQYLRRLRWLRMGQGRQFVFVISCTDPVPRVIIAANADISVGM